MSKRSAGSDLHQDNWQHDEESEEMGVFQKASDDEMKTRKIRKGKRTLTAESSSESTGPSIFQNLSSFGKSSSSAIPSFSFVSSNSVSIPKELPSFKFSKNSEESSTNGLKINKSCDTDKETTSMFQFKPSSNEAKPKKSIDEQSLESSKCSLFGLNSPKECEKGNASIFSDKSKVISPFSLSGNRMNTFGTENAEKCTASLFQFGSTNKKIVSTVNNKLTTNILSCGNESPDKDYLSDLQCLNENVLDWIKDHLDKNKFINLNPIFEDYKTHFEKLQKNKTKDCTDTEKKMNFDKPSFSFPSETSSSSHEKKSSALEELKFSASTPLSILSNDLKSSYSDLKGSDFSFSSKKAPDTSSSSLFSFGPGTKVQGNSSGFSFGTSASNFSFATKANESSTNISTASEEKEESDEPPKVEITEVKEDDAIYEKKVKLFYKKDNNYVDKGIGTLFLKPTKSKVQLVVRALTNLGNILLNIVLNDSLPTQRTGKNNVLLVCVPNPPIDTNNPSSPVTFLIRVKTSDDADELLAKIDENKKS